MDSDTIISGLAREQSGLVSRQQLLAAGLTHAAIRWRTARTWQYVLPSVVAVERRPLTEGQRLVAAALEAGLDGVVTGQHACAWHGLRSALLSGPVVVLVPENRASRQAGFVQVRRTRRPDLRPFERPPLRIASRSRAVIDACQSTALADQAVALVIEAVQRRLVRIEDLEHELAAAGQRHSRAARRAVREARAGAWSLPEADALRLCGTSSVLPRALPNPRITTDDGRVLISPDLWFDDVAMAVMVHSRSHHLRDRAWEDTVERDGQLTAHGVTVVGVTPRSIKERPAEVLARIEQTYVALQASGRQRPPVRAQARGWGLASA